MKTNAEIAANLDAAIKSMIEPTDEKDRIPYRKCIRAMRWAEMRLRHIAEIEDEA